MRQVREKKCHSNIMSCPYRDVFGKVGQGVHAYRVFNIAIVDVVATILVAMLLHWWSKLDVFVLLGILFLLGILAHRAFCVRTTVDRWLFP